MIRRSIAISALALSVAAVTSLDVRASRGQATAPPLATRTVTWTDVAPIAARLERQGVSAATFDAWVARLSAAHAARVREGDLDHLVSYLLQSRRFTARPPIEPALSARALVEALPDADRATFLKGTPESLKGTPASAVVPPEVRARIRDLLRALERPGDDAQAPDFADIVRTTYPEAPTREARIGDEYLRVMRFLYEKEFVAQRAPQPADAIAALYRTRGLSTDTAAEAGYLVSTGLGIVHALNPERRLRRVLIIGPGLDLAPRTALIEEGEPESYQPWAVLDALLADGLAALPSIDLVAADINPRVVSHLDTARSRPPVLHFVSGIADDGRTSLTREYRDYFSTLGNAIGTVSASAGAQSTDGRLRRTVTVAASAARSLTASPLDVVVARFEAAPFDLIVATNVLPYFDDDELGLALANIAGMLAPGGVFLHNEARPVMRELTTALGLPIEQSRHAVIATVQGSPTPLYDSVWVHRKAR